MNNNKSLIDLSTSDTEDDNENGQNPLAVLIKQRDGFQLKIYDDNHLNIKDEDASEDKTDGETIGSQDTNTDEENNRVNKKLKLNKEDEYDSEDSLISDTSVKVDLDYSSISVLFKNIINSANKSGRQNELLHDLNQLAYEYIN